MMSRLHALPSSSRTLLALRDLVESFRLWPLATRLGWLDVKLQFSGSTLGPLWLTLTTAIMIGAMGGIYSQLFHLNVREYLPYLSVSMILWQNGIAAIIQESTNTFTQAANTIRSVTMPYGVQALRTTIRCAIILCYTAIVAVAVFIILGKWSGPVALLALPALAIWFANCLACCLLLGTLGTRFRDIPPIISSLLQLAFYLTPVIWVPAQLKSYAWILYFNPFYSMLEIVRSPLLGHPATSLSWLIATGWSLLMCLSALFIFARTRSRLAFWI